MPEPEADGSEFKHGEEVGGVLFAARGDTAAMFDPALSLKHSFGTKTGPSEVRGTHTRAASTVRRAACLSLLTPFGHNVSSDRERSG